MAGGKEKEKIMLNMSDLQILITEHERKKQEKQNTTEAVNSRFQMCVHANVYIHMESISKQSPHSKDLNLRFFLT